MDELDDLTIPDIAEIEPKEELPSVQLFSKTERDIIELSLENLTAETIALRLALPKSVILSVLARPDIQDHLRTLSESLNQLETMRLKNLCERMIDEKMTEAEENGTSLSKKDILEVIKVYNDILSAERKAKTPKEQENIYINILNNIMEK